MSSGPEIVVLASSLDTLKWHDSAVWGAWTKGVLPETRNKTLKQEIKAFISPLSLTRHCIWSELDSAALPEAPCPLSRS